MKEKLNKLIAQFFKLQNKKPSTGFKEYLNLYLEPSKDITVTTNDILNITRKTQLDVNLAHYDTNEQNLIYVFCKLTTLHRKRPAIGQIIRIPLRKIALGLDETERFEKITEETEILQALNINSQTYKKFKSISEGSTMSHLHFLKIAKDYARNFELRVLELQESDILAFYVNLKPYFKIFLLLDQINNHFNETRNPYSFLKFYLRDFSRTEDTLLCSIVRNCTAQLNINLNEWLSKGQFTDYAREFFISKNTEGFWLSYDIDTEMLPFFISKETAKKILYIGKVSNLLTQIESHFDERNVLGNKMEIFSAENVEVDILSRNFDSVIDDKLRNTNLDVKRYFVSGCSILDYVIFCKETFFFGRNDFIEHLLFYMKDISKNNQCKRSYTFILDSAIQASFKKMDQITSALDMCVLKDDDFSLFYHLEFPVNVVIEKDVILIFLSIFKYLWRVKKIEHFLRKLKDQANYSIQNIVTINKWYFFIQKIFFYFSFEVIEKNFIDLLMTVQNEIFLIDELRRGTKRFLRHVIHDLFQENNKGKEQMDAFLNGLEQECFNFRKHVSIFDDSHIKKSLGSLFNVVVDRLESTTLFNVPSYFI